MAGAGTAGEREAAGTAPERVKARLAEQARCDPAIELHFSMDASEAEDVPAALPWR